MGGPHPRVAANGPIPLKEVPGKWIFAVKLSSVLFLMLLLNTYILKLKENHCDATKGKNKILIQEEYGELTWRLREDKLKQLTLKHSFKFSA